MATTGQLDALMAERAWTLIRVDAPHFDVARLNAIVDEHCAATPSSYQGHPRDKYSGWAMQSADGTQQSAFYSGANAWSTDGQGQPVLDRSKLPKFVTADCTKPTELYPVFKEALFDVLASVGIERCFRSRIVEIGAGGGNKWHIDAPYCQRGSWRVHIPLQTNPGAVFHWQDNEYDPEAVAHAPADGSMYLFRSDIRHYVVNKGDAMRRHVLLDTPLTTLMRLDLPVTPVAHV